MSDFMLLVVKNEIARLRRVIDDRDQYISDLEHKSSEYSSENQRIFDQYNRLYFIPPLVSVINR